MHTSSWNRDFPGYSEYVWQVALSALLYLCSTAVTTGCHLFSSLLASSRLQGNDIATSVCPHMKQRGAANALQAVFAEMNLGNGYYVSYRQLCLSSEYSHMMHMCQTSCSSHGGPCVDCSRHVILNYTVSELRAVRAMKLALRLCCIALQCLVLWCCDVPCCAAPAVPECKSTLLQLHTNTLQTHSNWAQVSFLVSAQ